MIIEFDTEDNALYLDGKLVYKPNITDISIADLMAEHRGEKEYEGVVADIQNWYYGSLVKQAWCATGLSYFAYLSGVLDKIGGKNENVYAMLNACKGRAQAGDGTFYDKANIPTVIKKNDILFWLWNGDTMTATSAKHVNVAEYGTSSDVIYAIGCNQKDKICTIGYNKSQLYAVYRIGG